MPSGSLLFPVYIGRIVIEVGVNDDITFDEGGPGIVATIAPGEYFLTGLLDASDLCLAIKTAMDAVGGQVYTVSAFYDERTGLPTCGVVIQAAGNFTLQFSIPGGLDPAELGFPAVDTIVTAKHNSTLSPVSGWVPDQPIVRIEPAPDEIPAIEHVSPGNRVAVFIAGVRRQPRLDELRLVGDERTWRLFSPLDEARSFQSWWNVVRDARPIRVYHAADPRVTLTALELAGTYRLMGDNIRRMPAPVRSGRANLYDFDLTLRDYVA